HPGLRHLGRAYDGHRKSVEKGLKVLKDEDCRTVSSDLFPKNGKKGLRMLSFCVKLNATGKTALARRKRL
ncbi:MAG: hypothetical protein J6K94_00140, partial [Ruminiclostridium sp.]|nr:hypothetical protein [Ruminiclostridium sp.]MBP3519874.1 hypothetical protein [Oscillospiraceae bacterium]